MSVDVRDILLSIRDEVGVLTPAVVVDAARGGDHPLHSRFEWDDTVAAERHRESQARELIRSVRVEYVTGSGAAADLRGFVSVSRGDVPSREYVPVDEVAGDPLLVRIVLRDAEREWRQLLARYEHLSEFLALVRRDVAA